MGIEKLKQAIEDYEKATEWVINNYPEDVEKHYDRYLKVIEKARIAMDEHVKTLGYNPYKNYEELKEALK
jgi:hypothetical protein